MKKLQLLALCAITSLLTACGGSEKYDLGYKLEAGKNYTQKMSVDMAISQPGMDIKTIMSCGYNYDVIDTTGGKYTIDMTFNTIEMKMSMPGNEMAFSSEDTSGIVNPMMPVDMSKMFRAMKGIPFHSVFTKQGKIEAISGMQAMMDSVVASMGLSEEAAMQARAAAGQSFNEEKMKEQLQNMAIYPDHKVAIGDSWETNVKSEMMDMKNTYTLKSVTDIEAVIEGNSTMTMNISGMSLSGTQTSTIAVDRTSGWIKSGQATQDLKGSGVTIKTSVSISE